MAYEDCWSSSVISCCETIEVFVVVVVVVVDSCVVVLIPFFFVLNVQCECSFFW